MSLAIAVEEVVKVLRKLYRLKAEDAAEYEVAVRDAFSRIMRLFEVKNKEEIRLKANIESIGEFTARYCAGQGSIEATSDTILGFLTNGPVANGNYLQELQESIKEFDLDASDTSIGHLIREKLAKAARVLLRSSLDTEKELQKYVRRCLLYDVSYYGHETGYQASDESQKLARLVQSTPVMMMGGEEEEKTVFQKSGISMQRHTEVFHPLKLVINRESFTKIYNCLSHSFMCDPELSIAKVAWCIVQLFKQHENIIFFESKSTTATLARLLPERFTLINERLFLGGESKVHPAREKNMLLPELKQLYSELCKYSADADPDFPDLFAHYYNLYCTHPAVACTRDNEYIQEVHATVAILTDPGSKDVPLDGPISMILSLQTHLIASDCQDLSSTLLMRQSFFEFHEQWDLRRRMLFIWLKKVEQIASMSVKETTQDRLLKRILRKWHIRSRQVEFLNAEVINYRRQVLQEQTLLKFRKTAASLGVDEAKADAMVTKKFLKMWQEKCSSSMESESRACEIDCVNLWRRHFTVWRFLASQAAEKAKSLSIKCSEEEEALERKLLLRVWTSWHRKTLVDSNSRLLQKKLCNFKTLHRGKLTASYYQKWLKLFKFNLECEILRNKFLESRSRSILVNWRHRVQSLEIAHDFHSRHNTHVTSNFFKKWSAKASQNAKADDANRRFVLRTSLRMWKLHYDYKKFEREAKTRLQVQLLKAWRLRCIGRKLAAVKDDKLARQICARLKTRCTTRSSLDKKAADFIELKLKKNTFSKLENRLARIESLQQSSTVTQLAKFLQVWRGRLSNFKHLEKVEFKEQNLPKKMLMIWLQKTDDAVEMRLSQNVEQLDLYTDQLIKRKYLRLLRQRLDDAQAYFSPLNDIANNFNSISCVRPFFTRWQERWRVVENLEDLAGEWNETLLASRLGVWYAKWSAIRDMEEEAADLMDQNISKIVRAIIQRWDFKYRKNIRRHHQLCEDFKLKKDSKQLLDFMNLWIHKLNVRQTVDLDEESIFLNNSSPLARRNQMRRSSSLTPDRSRRLTTPRSKRSSPTRLQETTQRIRDQRTRNLSERFANIKESPSPKRRPQPVPLKLEYSVNLPPPSRTASPRQSPANTSFDAPPNIVNTAKRMGKIRPISFPVEEEEKDLRISPLNLLKQARYATNI